MSVRMVSQLETSDKKKRRPDHPWECHPDTDNDPRPGRKSRTNEIPESKFFSKNPVTETNPRPWRLPDRYPHEPSDEWHRRNFYEWDKKNMETPTILDLIDKAVVAKALTTLLEKLDSTSKRVAEIQRALEAGEISAGEANERIISVRNWLRANV